MSRIIAIANVKGGAGKTTTTGNLAAALAERGRRVLVVDLDPQASLTRSLGLSTDEFPHSIHDSLSSRGAPVSSILVPTREHFDLAPAVHELLLAEQELVKEKVRITAVRSALEPLRGQYDYMLLDCPASAGILTGNALAAADEVLIPFAPEYLSLQVLDWLIEIIRELQRLTAPNLHVSGLFLANYDRRLRHSREVIAVVEKRYGATVPFFSAAVHQSVILRQASQLKQSVLRYAPDSQAARAYRTLAREVEVGSRSSGQDIQALLEDGGAALAEQHLERAYAQFSTATSVNPQRVEGWIGRGRSSSEWDEAVRCFGQALVLDPSRAETRTELESVLKAHLQAAVPSDVPQLMSLGHYLSAAGLKEYSGQVFARVLELVPSHEEALLSRARESTDSRQAAAFLHRALEINSENLQTRRELEFVESHLKAEAFAIVEYNESLMRAGANVQAHAGFKQAADLDPNNERAWIGCARTTGDLKQALGFVERALQVNPHSPQALELSDWLQKLKGDGQEAAPSKRSPLVGMLAAAGIIISIVLLALVFLR